MNNTHLEYVINQILNIDEVKTKEYLSYKLKEKEYFIFENFYFDFMKYYKRKPNPKENEIIEYLGEFSKKVTNLNEINNLLNNKNNIDFYA